MAKEMTRKTAILINNSLIAITISCFVSLFIWPKEEPQVPYIKKSRSSLTISEPTFIYKRPGNDEPIADVFVSEKSKLCVWIDRGFTNDIKTVQIDRYVETLEVRFR